MSNYKVSRAGVVKMVTALERHADGTLWSVSKPSMPLLDGEAPEFVAIGKDEMVALVKARKFSEIPAACFAHEGLNPSGLEVIDLAAARDAAIAARTPAQRERDRINGLFAQARRRADASDDNNVMDSMRLDGQARAALAKWREDYPAEAREENALSLEAQAEHEDDLALGALTYDADGDISQAEQQRRHDEYKAKAVALRAEAEELRK